MSDTSFNSLLDSFLAYLRNNKSSSENTVVNYSVDLTQYADFIEAQGLDALTVTTPAIRAYLRSLSGFGYASSSIARKLSSIKTFELYLLERRLISSDPAAAVRSPRIPERLPRALSREAMERLPHPYGLILDLVLIEGMDYAGISRLTGQKETTLRSWYSRGRAKLVKELKANRI